MVLKGRRPVELRKRLEEVDDMKDLVPWGGMNWAPFRELRREVNRLFDSAFHDENEDSATPMGWSPLVDIKETAEGYEVIAELPGLKRDDIRIAMTGNTLTLSGERKRAQDSQEENYHRVERYFGRFSRSFNFPHEVDASKVTAVYKDGLLVVRAPKAEKLRPREIDIRIADEEQGEK